VSDDPTVPGPGALVLLGGAAGIGADVLRAYVARRSDAPLWITYANDVTAAEALRDEVGYGEVVRCDVGDPDALTELAGRVRAQGQRVQTLVHAAVAAFSGPLIGSADRLRHALDVSAVSLVGAVSAFEDLLGDGASVTYLTSIGATRVMPKYAFVGVSKAAAEAIVRYLATELGRRGIRINAVRCGPVATKALANFGDTGRFIDDAAKRSPMRPPVSADEVGAVVAFLSSPAGRVFTGQVLDCDGGLTLWA
jgi:enoyl-[acyl-carrier protein] reductase I